MRTAPHAVFVSAVFASLVALAGCGRAEPTAVDATKTMGGAAGALPTKTEAIPATKAAPTSPTPDVTDVGSNDAAAPRDAASGLATGKRQHKPFTVSKPVD